MLFASRGDDPKTREVGSMALPWPHRRVTVDEYERMIEAGILGEDDRVELIRGEIVEMCAIGIRHAACVTRSSNLLTRRLGPEFLVSTQNPILIPDDGQPEPDLAVLRADYDEDRRPAPADVVFVIEVSDSSLDYDRRHKLPLYARAGIPEAWIFNLTADRIERHTDPGTDGYRSIAFAERGQSLPSTVLPDLVLDVTELLGEDRRPR
jgi:Uma2 family endonuclease